MLEQDPLPGTRRRRLRLPHPVLLEAGGRADGQHRARPGRRPRHRRTDRRRSDEEARRSRIQPVVEEVSSSNSVEEGLVDLLRTARRRDRDPRLDVTIFVSSGPKLVKVPVLVETQRRGAVQQIRSRDLVPEVTEEETSNAAPGEVIRQSPSAGTKVDGRLDRVDRRRQGGEADQGAERGRHGTPRSGGTVREAGLTPVVEEEETESKARSAASLEQLPAAARRSRTGLRSDADRRQAAQAFSEEGEEG